jgi:hypothetical protein
MADTKADDDEQLYDRHENDEVCRPNEPHAPKW